MLLNIFSKLQVNRNTAQARGGEKRLRESEEKHRLLIEKLEDIVWTLDLDLNLTYVSASVEKKLGLTPEELMPKALYEQMPQRSLQYAQGLFRKELAHEQEEGADPNRTLKFELEVYNKDGSSLCFENIVTGLRNDKGVLYGLHGLSRDITENKRAEEELRESEERFRVLSEAAFEGILIHDKGRIIVANKAFADMFGYGLDEVIGMHILDFAPPEWRNRIKNMEPEKERPYEAVGIRKDGSSFPSELRGGKIAYRGRTVNITAVRDLTEQKQAEERLRTSEKSFRELFNSIADLIYTQDLEGRFLSANPALTKLFGYEYDEILGRKAADFMKPELGPEFEREYLGTVREKGYYEGISSYFTKNGSKIYIEYRSRLVQPDEGEPYISGIGRDVTERVLAEKEKEDLEAQLHQAQKMEAIGTLAGGIAHNFNNVLTGIQGQVSLMLMDKRTSDPDVEYLKGIEEYVRDATELTKDLLGFARGGQYETKPTDLNTLIKHENQMFGRTKKDVEIHGKYEEDLWTVKADRGQIRQVLMNLYVNACQAMPGGGYLYVETENVTLGEDYVRPHGLFPGRYVKISVSDTGVGMDEKTKERIFDPFFSTQEEGRGTGLGLASVYGIMKSHGGLIKVHSKKGQGTRFDLYLPATPPEDLPKEKPAKEAEAVRYGKGTVLLVDDENMIISVGQKLLSKLGYTVLTAESGKEAVELYKDKKEEIELVILDMIMPGMGGGEIFDSLKKINPEVKVLLATGYSFNEEAKQILSRGCRGFIQKPFKFKALSNKINSIIKD